MTVIPKVVGVVGCVKGDSVDYAGDRVVFQLERWEHLGASLGL